MIWIDDIIYEILNHNIYLSLTLSVNRYFCKVIKKYRPFQLFLRHRQQISCAYDTSFIIKNLNLYVSGYFNNHKYDYFTLIQKNVLSVSCYGSRAVIITPSDTFYYKYNSKKNINLKNILAVTIGVYDTLILTINYLYLYTDRLLIRLDFDIQGIQKITPTLILKNNLVYRRIKETFELVDLNQYTDIVCGRHYSLLLNEKNEVFGLGINTNGCLGIELNLTDQPTKIMDNVVSMFCGNYYSLFLKMDGQVYGCGDNYRGQLLGYDNFLIPTKRNIRFNDIGCGEEHLIYRDEHKYYGVGYNRQSQLGLGPYKNKKYRRPQQIKKI